MARTLGHVITVDTLHDLLSLVMDKPPDPTVIVSWTRKQRAEAERWASMSHLAASDNQCKVPDMPDFLQPIYPSIEIGADWTVIKTGPELELYFSMRFKFEGPGVYFHGKDSMIIVPIVRCDNPWAKTWPKDTQFRVYVWNNHDISQTINLLVNAPTRYDER